MAVKPTVMGNILAQKYNEMARGTNNNNEATQTNAVAPSTGGINISRELLPDVKVGDVLTLKVTAVDENQVSLERA